MKYSKKYNSSSQEDRHIAEQIENTLKMTPEQRLDFLYELQQIYLTAVRKAGRAVNPEEFEQMSPLEILSLKNSKKTNWKFN